MAESALRFAFLDEGLLRAVYRLASVPAEDVLADLRPGSPLLSVDAVATLPPEQIDPLVDRYIRDARLQAGVAGAGLGLVGWAGVPPGIAHVFVLHIRLAQRVAMAYGTDWRTDRGEIELWRGLAAAVEARVDWEGLDADLLGKLPAIVAGPGTVRNPLLLRAIQAVALRVAQTAGLRATRWVPVIGSGTGLVLGFLQIDRVGKRLKRNFRARHGLSRFDGRDALEAEIVSG